MILWRAMQTVNLANLCYIIWFADAKLLLDLLLRLLSIWDSLPARIRRHWDNNELEVFIKGFGDNIIC